MKSKKVLISSLLTLLIVSLVSCVDGQYGSYPNSGYPNPGYPNSGYGYPPPNNYPGQYYPPPANNYPPPNNYPAQYYPPPAHRHPPAPVQQPAYQPPAPPPEPVIRPSCPSGSVFDGRSCNITDSRLRRPGGDGRINPCPSGMHVSGDKCIR